MSRSLRLSSLARHTRVRAARRDVGNVVRYGAAAPKAHELVYVETASIQTALVTGVPPAQSGMVVEGDWDLAVKPVGEVSHIRQCLEHWGDGRSWEEVGAIDHVLELVRKGRGTHGGMSTRADVERRYAGVDQLLQTISVEGVLRTRKEIVGRGFREHGGILIHFGREGQPIYNGWQGCHRLAAAIQCDVTWIPVQVGMVHRQAVKTWRNGVRSSPPA